ncbi:MAG: restriction endonuclease subunit S, partial [Ruminococcus sp.]|nr:restriction endonuclease subunit S [Ruminococcus sp.]
MSKLNDLINELCPDGVEYIKIKDICEISRGKVISKDYIKDNPGDFPVYSSQTENNGELGKISTYMFDGNYITWTTDGANAGTVFYRTGKFNITNVCGLLNVKSENIIIKFVYYILQTKTLNYVNKGMGNPKLMSNIMAEISIFAPPLEVQKEIVRILDNFTDYIDCLEKELELRKKQYSYYRDKLLTFGNDVEYKTLNEITTLSRGVRVVKNQLEKTGNIPVYQNSMTPLGYYTKSNCKANTTFIIGAGSAGEIGFSSVEFWSADDCYYFI